MAYTAEQTAILEREPQPTQGTTSAEVAYEVDGTACSGYVARPDARHAARQNARHA